MANFYFILITQYIIISSIEAAYSPAALELWQKIKAGTVGQDNLREYEKEVSDSYGMTYQDMVHGVKAKLDRNLAAKKKQITDNVSMPGLVLLSKYTTSLFTDMNTLARQIDKNAQDKWTKNNMQTMKTLKRIAVLADTLNKLELIIPYTGNTVYRFEAKFDGWQQQYVAGETFTMSAFTSTSTDSVAQSGIGGNDLKLTIKLKRGVDIKSLSENEGENEILIPIGEQFHVDDINTEKQPVEIKLSQQ